MLIQHLIVIRIAKDLVSTLLLIHNICLYNVSGKSQPINTINEGLRKGDAENGKKLEPIVDTIKLCGRLNLEFRGHRDDSRYHPDVDKYSDGGVGNFIELLNLLKLFIVEML